jgi:hypothetical protein
LPNISDSGLSRVIELLDSASPFLIHGAFHRSCAMGCLATHIAWHHPKTEHLGEEAGVIWLTRIAGLNPGTSLILNEWDRAGLSDWNMRHELLQLCREESSRRQALDEAQDREYEVCVST